MFWTLSHMLMISSIADILVIQSETLPLNGAEYRLVAMPPSAIDVSSSFSMSSAVATMSSTTRPCCLNSLKTKMRSSQSPSTCLSLISTCSSFTAPAAHSSMSSKCFKMLHSTTFRSLKVSSAMSSSEPVISWNLVQCLGLMAGAASIWISGSISRKSSIFFRRSTYAGQSRIALGSFLHCAWNDVTVSVMTSICSLTSCHRMST